MELHDTPVKRHLTSVEIQDILNRLPKIKAAVVKIAVYETDQIKEKLRNQLREIMIYPENIQMMGNIFLNQFHRSVIPAGEAIGPSTSEGIGGPATQMTLNTFHQAGSAEDIASGLDKLRELLNMTKVRKSNVSYIHFKNKDLTQDEVIGLKRQIVGVSVSKLMSKHPTIIKAQMMLPDGSSKAKPLEERGWWYNAYLKMVAYQESELNFFEVSHYLRITLDRNKLYTYDVSVPEIINTIESEQSGVVKCIASPCIANEIVVDIYVDNNSVTKPLKEHIKHRRGKDLCSFREPSFYAFMYVIIPELIDDTSFIIKGIHNVTHISPKIENINNIILSVVKSDREDDLSPELLGDKSREDIWFFWINEIAVRSDGIPMSKVRKLITAAGIPIIESPEQKEDNPFDIFPKPWVQPDPSPKKYVVHMVGKGMDGTDLKGLNPQKYISSLLDKANQEESDNISTQLSDGRKGNTKGVYSDLLRHSVYCYAIGAGSNLRAMLNHPDVDGTQSITNDANVIYTVLGIQAAYSSIVRDFYHTITGSGAYCSPQHITTLAASMTNFTPMAITSRCVSRQNRGAFADASFEHAVEIFVKAATSGKTENVKATSTSIFFGNRGNFGTGSFKLALNMDAIRAIEHAVHEVDNDVSGVNTALSDMIAKSVAFKPTKPFVIGKNFDFSTFVFNKSDDVNLPEPVHVFTLTEVGVGELPDSTNVLTFLEMPQLDDEIMALLS